MPNKNIFLFSIDLEDARENVADGHKYADKVVANTETFLNWLKHNKFNCTFFTVGKVAEKYPSLIKDIVSQGHEIACHSYNHTPLDKLGEESFRSDLDKNINALLKAGASEIKGFRAPIFSLTQNCTWAYDVLKEFNLTYSSSVLPAKNPLYGWENFGQGVKKLDNGIIELPITLTTLGPLQIPITGGVYFRVLPYFLIRNSIQKSFSKNQPVLSYFHPYDIDADQEKYMHAGINDSKFYNYLMYYNRKKMFSRLNKLLQLDLNVMTYNNYIKNHIQ